jgi:UDP-N-acetylglucosamine 1-carboxyvinyltransferase
VISELEIQIEGQARLKGKVEVSTSKNAVLPILAASLLTDEPVIIHHIPDILDVHVMLQLLSELGVDVEKKEHDVILKGSVYNTYPPYELVKQIRASFLVMGPILARKQQVRISLPGGCAIGNRPVDLHLKGISALGAEIVFSGGDVIASLESANGSHIYLDFPSVGATENMLMIAALAQGTTYIENAALEPEIVDLANFINCMGGKISGAGTHIIRIEGVEALRGCDYTPIPDRIEAGSHMVAAAASRGEVRIYNTVPDHLKAISAKLIETGAVVEQEEDHLYVQGAEIIKPIYIKTLPYPGFPTDMQAQFMAYLCLAEGSSIISETVFENRFMHVPELLRMGADIKTEGRTAIVGGNSRLSGAHVMATDLRAGAALMIAAICAAGSSVIANSEHIYRGYENFTGKFQDLGAHLIETR